MSGVSEQLCPLRVKLGCCILGRRRDKDVLTRRLKLGGLEGERGAGRLERSVRPQPKALIRLAVSRVAQGALVQSALRFRPARQSHKARFSAGDPGAAA